MTGTPDRIDAVLAHFTDLGGGDPGDDQATLTDILADLMLWAATTPSPQDLDFERALESARLHFTAES